MTFADLPCALARYEHELRNRMCTEALLREALVKVETTLRQENESVEQVEILSEMFLGQNGAANRPVSLTPRQRKIMEMVLTGHPSKNIAAELGISIRTVENHRGSIVKKTGSKSFPALVRFALGAAWNGIDRGSFERNGRRHIERIGTGKSMSGIGHS